MPEKLRAYVRNRKITSAAIEYGRIEIRHADVMGSGRCFYASKPAVTKINLAK